MESRHYLGVADYVVIASIFLISSGIGILFRCSGGRQKTVSEYLLAGKNMAFLPVVLSISVTVTSTSTMLGTPAEIYRYGIQHIMAPFGTVIGMYLASRVLVPVYFQCGVSTSYEFLELRYGKFTRGMVSIAFLFQNILYTSAVLYGPALALSAVTDISLKTSIFVVGGVCTFYCVLGGLKAVIWTDAFQALLMFTCVVVFYAAGIGDGVGVSTIFDRASTGKRTEIFNFSLDFTKRYTFWNCFIRGIFLGFANYGSNQLQIQRMLSMSSSSRATRVLQYSILPVFLLHIMCNLIGLVLYSIYYLCDPILNTKETGLTRYDQILPYYIVNKFSSIPGLTGLCIAGIFSGSLSTASSGLNSLSMVTIMDIVQPHFFKSSEKKTVTLAKFFSLAYGVLCVALTFSFSSIKSLKQLSVSFLTISEGSFFSLFVIGVLTRKVSDKIALVGTLLSFPAVCWLLFGSLLSGYREPSLELNTSKCFMQNMSLQMQHITDNYLYNKTITSQYSSLPSPTTLRFCWYVLYDLYHSVNDRME